MQSLKVEGARLLQSAFDSKGKHDPTQAWMIRLVDAHINTRVYVSIKP